MPQYFRRVALGCARGPFRLDVEDSRFLVINPNSSVTAHVDLTNYCGTRVTTI